MVSAVINSWSSLAKQRPSQTHLIVSALSSWTPNALSGLPASSIKSVEKGVRILLVHLSRRVPYKHASLTKLTFSPGALKVKYTVSKSGKPSHNRLQGWSKLLRLKASGRPPLPPRPVANATSPPSVRKQAKPSASRWIIRRQRSLAPWRTLTSHRCLLAWSQTSSSLTCKQYLGRHCLLPCR